MVPATASSDTVHVTTVVNVTPPIDTVAHLTVTHSNSEAHTCSPVCTAH